MAEYLSPELSWDYLIQQGYSDDSSQSDDEMSEEEDGSWDESSEGMKV